MYAFERYRQHTEMKWYWTGLGKADGLLDAHGGCFADGNHLLCVEPLHSRKRKLSETSPPQYTECLIPSVLIRRITLFVSAKMIADSNTNTSSLIFHLFRADKRYQLLYLSTFTSSAPSPLPVRHKTDVLLFPTMCLKKQKVLLGDILGKCIYSSLARVICFLSGFLFLYFSCSHFAIRVGRPSTLSPQHVLRIYCSIRMYVYYCVAGKYFCATELADISGPKRW